MPLKTANVGLANPVIKVFVKEIYLCKIMYFNDKYNYLIMYFNDKYNYLIMRRFGYAYKIYVVEHQP